MKTFDPGIRILNLCLNFNQSQFETVERDIGLD